MTALRTEQTGTGATAGRVLRQRAAKASRIARRNLSRNLGRLVAQARTETATQPRSRSGQPTLAPSTALRENGFTVYRSLFSADECAQLAILLKNEARIQEGNKQTKVDSTNFYPTTRDVMLEGRIIDAVRSALGEQVRYLQVSDLHYLHDTAGWHRDSVHRAHDASAAPDWRNTGTPFGVVKAILYLESDNAAMGIMAGSHSSAAEINRDEVRAIEEAGRQLVIDAGDDPNRRLTTAERSTPLAWRAQIGDVLVFDERMYHAGRRVDDGRVSPNREAAKFTLSFVFGLENEHSERLYSYFRFIRTELHYKDLLPDFAAELTARGLMLDRGQSDFYAAHPEDLPHVHLPDPSTMDALLDRYAGTTK